MPTPSATSNRPEDVILRLCSPETEVKFKALRELKNQIIGNRTKKLSYVKLGAVPAVVSALSSSADAGDFAGLVQASAVIGSFACGLEAGVRAVLDAGALSLLFRLISHHSDHKVVDAVARSLRMIYRSKLAPKYDLVQKENIDFLLSLLNSKSENLTGLGASIITHSCQTTIDQKALCEAGVLKKLLSLLEGSLNQRDASLESLSTIIRSNPDVSSEFMEADSGRAFRTICELTKDRYPRTRLLASMCLIAMWNTSPSYPQDAGLRTKLILVLLELLDEPGQVGDEAPFALSSLVARKEDLQKLAFEAGFVDRLSNHLRKGPLQAKRVQGIFLALAEVCSKLEACRSRLLSLEILKLIAEALTHESSEVRVAACICLQSVSRSVKSLSAGLFLNEMLVIPLLQLLNGASASASVQVAALRAISNIVVEFTTRKSTFVQCGGVKQLVHLAKSMDPTIRLNAVWVLRNLVFLADNRCKEEILLELTPSTLSSLICDPEPPVQQQALGFVRNLVDGSIDSIGFIFTEEAIILHAVGRQLRSTSKDEVCVQGMYVLGNVASGNEFHKESVLQQLLPSADSYNQCVLVKFLRSSDNGLRTAAAWTVVNLTFHGCPGAYRRLVKLRNAGVYSQIKNMTSDPCLDVKLRVKTALVQSMTFGDSSS